MRCRVLACLLIAACFGWAQGSAGRIDGRVVNSITGASIRRVHLTLTLSGPQPSRFVAVSDADGRFVFERLAAGAYTLSAQRTGSVQQDYAASSPAAILVLSAGQVIRNIVFKLVPQGVIAGRVVDDEGEPVPRVIVRAIPAPGFRGRSRIAGTSTTTNDLGEYRLAELSPGSYLVMATPMHVTTVYAGVPPAQSHPSEALSATYFPAVADPASAIPLAVSPGQEVSGTTIRLRRGSLYRVQGTVIPTPQDGASSRIMLQLSPRQAASSITPTALGESTGRIQPDGSFLFGGVEPGDYNLVATRVGGRLVVVGRLPITVGNSDLSGLAFALREPLRLEGTIRVEGAREADFTKSQILLYPLEPYPLSTPNAKVNADHQFTLEHVPPDSYSLTVSPLSTGAYVKSVRVDHRESPDGVLELSDARTGAAVEILVSPNGATIEVTVNGPEEPVSRAFLALLSEPLGRTSMVRMRMQRTQKGKVSFTGVPPGDYRLYAFDPDEISLTQNDDPAVLKPYQSKAVRVDVGERERKQVAVTVLGPD